MAGLEGKVALVTGAGGMRGIGRATALKLASQGADVAISDIHHRPEETDPGELRSKWGGIESVAKEIEALGRICLTTYCNLGYPDQIEKMVKQVIDGFGHIDILVNNARATSGQDKYPVTELPKEIWDRYLAINTTGFFLCIQSAAREMVRQGKGGRIVNMASIRSKSGSRMGSAYVASKFAVLGLTQCAALDLAPYKITVNAVCPGTIDTNRFDYWEKARAVELGVPQEEHMANRLKEGIKSIPLGRAGEPQDVANLVAFLASPEAEWITGQAYNINGGELFH